MKTANKDYPVLGWTAWVDTMPGSDRSFHIIGSVFAPTPCHEPKITPNPDVVVTSGVLQLKLEFIEIGGGCSDVITKKDVSYAEKAFAGDGDSVLVLLPDGVKIAMPIKDVQ